MESQIDVSLWVLTLASKYTSWFSSPFPIIFFLLSLLCLTRLSMALLHWAHPGGPSWGKYWAQRGPVRPNKPIPGPKGCPLIGSMGLMTGLAHHKLEAMANRLNARRLMAFSMGETRVVITCNPEVAKEILCSPAFTDRPMKDAAYQLMFDRAMGFAPYGVYWKTLRRITAVHVFSPKQIKLYQGLRSDIASQMVRLISSRSTQNAGFRIRDILKRGALMNMMGTVFGKKYDKEIEEMEEMVEEGYELLGKLNWGDHLSWMRGWDPQSVRFRCSKLRAKVNRILNRIIWEEHKKKGNNSRKRRDFMEVLMSLQDDGPDKLSHDDILAVLWEMILRGTDTVAVVIEWALARMVLHPHLQSKVHHELDTVVGKSQPLIESHLPSLPYLRGVIKEVLRVHPPGPLLSWARLSLTDTCIDGYRVPAGTTAVINMWAIMRDPQFWSDPVNFSPDRFLVDGHADVEVSVYGSDLRIAPFGSGRRSCPGKGLGMATITFWIGTLLHEFEWKPSDQNPVDLTEKLKLSCEMASPLHVRVHSRRR